MGARGATASCPFVERVCLVSGCSTLRVYISIDLAGPAHDAVRAPAGLLAAEHHLGCKTDLAAPDRQCDRFIWIDHLFVGTDFLVAVTHGWVFNSRST